VPTSLSNRIFVGSQYLMPRRGITAFAGWVAGARAGAVTQWIIRRFIARYGVNMQEAAAPDPAVYASFNEFFTRALAPGARPLATAALVCPVDGAISSFGSVEQTRIFQAKGHDYSVRALLAGDEPLAQAFRDG